MKLYKLTPEDVQKAAATPEDGMGFQIARLSGSGTPEHGVLINGEFFAPFGNARLLLETRGFVGENYDLSEGLLLSPPTEFTDLGETARYVRRSLLLEAAKTRGARMIGLATGSTLPPHTAKTLPGEVFYRFSVYRADHRMMPDGSLKPGTYSTTKTDITVVPSGLAAVGRYALPTRISAREVFEIRPIPGTSILYGTVTPNYGLAGGGVEVLFPSGTTPGTVKHHSTWPEK